MSALASLFVKEGPGVVKNYREKRIAFPPRKRIGFGENEKEKHDRRAKTVFRMS